MFPKDSRNVAKTKVTASASPTLDKVTGMRSSAQNSETIAQAYRRIIDSDAFRAACGRIAASYAW